MSAETSGPVAALAAKVLEGHEPTRAEILSLAGSALAQREPDSDGMDFVTHFTSDSPPGDPGWYGELGLPMMEALAQREPEPDSCGLLQDGRRGDWMQTFTGRQYWPLDPRPDDVVVEDIAHHLSFINRYCGASLVPWSVAVHSLGVLAAFDAWAAEQRPDAEQPLSQAVRLAVLLHDAPEAYCNDVVRPVKRHLPGYGHVERINADAIAAALNVPYLLDPVASVVKAADNAMLLAEQEFLMAPAPAKWSPLEVPTVMLDAAKAFVQRNQRLAFAPLYVESLFMDTYRELTR